MSSVVASVDELLEEDDNDAVSSEVQPEMKRVSMRTIAARKGADNRVDMDLSFLRWTIEVICNEAPQNIRLIAKAAREARTLEYLEL